MKYALIIALTLLFSQNILAEENEKSAYIEAGKEASVQDGPVMVSMIKEDTGLFLKKDSPFKPAELDLTNIEYYEVSDKPNYKPRNTILLGGVLPLIPIRSNIDASAEDQGLFQKSVSVLMYFKQKF